MGSTPYISEISPGGGGGGYMRGVHIIMHIITVRRLCMYIVTDLAKLRLLAAHTKPVMEIQSACLGLVKHGM